MFSKAPPEPEGVKARSGLREDIGSFPAAFTLAFILAGLYLTSLYSQLLFHSLAEGFGIAACVGIFMIAWHSRRFLDNGYLSFIGIAYLFVAGLDMIHTLAYEGAGVFPGYGPELSLGLWIAARYLQAAALLAAPFFLGRRLRYNATILGLALLTFLLTAAIFLAAAPGEGAGDGRPGMLPRAGEYPIVVLLVGALAALAAKRRHFEPSVFRWLMQSLSFTAAAEIFFISLADDYGPMSTIGHLFNIVAYYLIYRAVIHTGLVKPYSLLFLNLKRSEEALRKDNDALLALQRQLADKNVELRKLNDQKNQFLGMVAHDLRSPLSIFSFYSEYVAEGAKDCLTPEKAGILARMGRSALFMLNMVDNLLDIATIESGRLNLEYRATDLTRLVEENVRLNGTLAEKKGIRLVFAPAGSVPEAEVDPQRVEQALTNLVINALKFSPPGTDVTAGIQAGDGEAVIWVSDQGPGILPAEREKLFRPFEKASAVSTAGEKGAGLGLAIVRKIVEDHGGRIRVDSEPGHGATFRFTLPLKRRSQA